MADWIAIWGAVTGTAALVIEAAQHFADKPKLQLTASLCYGTDGPGDIQLDANLNQIIGEMGVEIVFVQHVRGTTATSLNAGPGPEGLKPRCTNRPQAAQIAWRSKLQKKP